MSLGLFSVIAGILGAFTGDFRALYAGNRQKKTLPSAIPDRVSFVLFLMLPI